jgi:hypothetical protein
MLSKKIQNAKKRITTATKRKPAQTAAQKRFAIFNLLWALMDAFRSFVVHRVPYDDADSEGHVTEEEEEETDYKMGSFDAVIVKFLI